MSILPIIRFGDSRLTVVCDRVPLVKKQGSSPSTSSAPSFVVPDDVKQLVADLRATMYNASGAGIAAPQVGITRRVALFGTGVPNPRYPGAAVVPKMALVNPLSIPLSRTEYAVLKRLQLLEDGLVDEPVAASSSTEEAAKGSKEEEEEEATRVVKHAIALFDAADAAETDEAAAKAEEAIAAFALGRSQILSSSSSSSSPSSDDVNFMTGFEGCLSVPGIRGVVTRHRFILYQGVSADTGVRQRRAACDFHARVFQHECDHLDGFVFPMRVTDWSKFGYTEELVERGLLPPLPPAPSSSSAPTTEAQPKQ